MGIRYMSFDKFHFYCILLYVWFLRFEVVLYCFFFVTYAIRMLMFLNNLVIILVLFSEICEFDPFLFCFLLDIVFLFVLDFVFRYVCCA
jgi:hypothetical protein